MQTIEEIGAKMDSLGLWDLLVPYNWAVKPLGSVFPYFCSVLKSDGKPVKVRLFLLEGWQTFHDYVRVRHDQAFGFISSPVELPHYELVVLATGEIKLLRHDAGYIPAEANANQRKFVMRLLWQVLGVMLRVEGDRELPMKFFGEQAIFARVERDADNWVDEPLEIPPARPHVEKVVIPKELLKKVVDLPLVSTLMLELDFRLLPNVMTRETRPRCVYCLLAIDATGKRLIDSRVSMHMEAGLRGLWETMPAVVVSELIRLAQIPGEIRLCSGRVFRLLRPLCTELPFKLTLRDSLPSLDAAYLTTAVQ